MVESSGQAPAANSIYWAQFTQNNTPRHDGPHDEADGPGIKVNGRKVSYIPSDRLKVRGCAIVDQKDHPILYFRAHGNPNISKPLAPSNTPSFMVMAPAAPPFPKFDANDNVQFFARQGDATTNAAAVKRIQAQMGDFDAQVGTSGTSFDGMIDGSESATVNGPYILWAAGPDEFYGPAVSEADLAADALKIKREVLKCDDIILATP
jgi:hypothetical protein